MDIKERGREDVDWFQVRIDICGEMLPRNGSLSSIKFGELITRGLVVLLLRAFLWNGNTLTSN